MKLFLSILLFATLFLLTGCGGTKELTEIKPLVIQPPVIHDTLTAIVTDTVIIGNTIVNHDTVTTVKYFPDIKKFYIKIKPDSIVYWDTVRTVSPPEKIETPLLAKIGLVFIGLVFGAIIFFIFKK